MKKVLFSFAIFVAGCGGEPKTIKVDRFPDGFGSLRYKIEVIDGCEYLVTPVKIGYSITHKGNCTNLIHNYVHFESKAQ